jgi:hypothetical protein
LKGILPFFPNHLLQSRCHMDRLFSKSTSNAFQLSQ